MQLLWDLHKLSYYSACEADSSLCSVAHRTLDFGRPHTHGVQQGGAQLGPPGFWSVPYPGTWGPPGEGASGGRQIPASETRDSTLLPWVSRREDRLSEPPHPPHPSPSPSHGLPRPLSSKGASPPCLPGIAPFLNGCPPLRDGALGCWAASGPQLLGSWWAHTSCPSVVREVVSSGDVRSGTSEPAANF